MVEQLLPTEHHVVRRPCRCLRSASGESGYRFMARAVCALQSYHQTMRNTKSAQRRVLRFDSLDDLAAEVDRVIAAEAANQVTYTGNWSLGQILGHLAAWMEFPYIGFPAERAPWLIRKIVGLSKKRFLTRGLPPGVRFPGRPEGTFATEPLDVPEGARRIRTALGRLKSGERPTHPSPVFGMLTLDEVVQLNLRHAELHLGFVHVKEQA